LIPDVPAAGMACWIRTRLTCTGDGPTPFGAPSVCTRNCALAGYTGSLCTCSCHRPAGKTPPFPTPPPAPAAKKVARWILSPLNDLTQITARCAELAAIQALVYEFAEMWITHQD
jgi:hypothetical protein